MSLVANEELQHILRVLNTNVDGMQHIMFALTSIKGIGRRLANIVCKKADVDMNKRVFVGTVSELCVKHVECPVITIKRSAGESPQDPADD